MSHVSTPLMQQFWGKYDILFYFLSLVSSVITQCISDVEKYGIDAPDQQIILNRHNEIRLLVSRGQLIGQPKATNLNKLVYDNELATKAQDAANNHVKSTLSVTDDRFSNVGQNIFVSQSSSKVCSSANWIKAINAWLTQSGDYQFGSGAKNFYTQLIWANTTHIGCGYSCFTEESLQTYLYICNYAPGADDDSNDPYSTTGRGCNGLCAAAE